MRRVVPPLVFLLALAIAAVAWATTGALPEAHKVARSGRYTVPKEDVWALVSDLEGAAAWRTDLAKVERLPDVRGHAVYRETHRDGETVSLETVETIPNRRLVRCVVDQGGPFGGCWTVEVAPRDDGSVVTLTEALTVHSAWFRLTHGVAGRKARLDAWLRAIGAKFGVEPRLADLPRELNVPRKAAE